MALCAPVNNTTSTEATGSMSALNLPDIKIPDLIAEKSKYELLGGGFEGDMIFADGFNPLSPNKAKGVARFGPRRWPNGIIPYDISAITSPTHRNTILNAMQTLAYAVGTPVRGQTTRRPCISFRSKQIQDSAYLKIIYGDGCSGTVGYTVNSVSKLTLKDPNCFYSGTIQHELMHILGFYHEQSRPDRDSYITVNYANIKSNLSYNFDKFQWGVTALNQNTSYDYGSIMHYPATAFSANGKPTITLKQSNVVIGQREALSSIDIAEIRAYYSC